MRLARRSVAHPCFAIARNGRCSCVCGCNDILSRDDINEVGDWCEDCLAKRGHRPTRGGGDGPFRISFDTDPTPAFGIPRPMTGDIQ